ncbi:hypothetical protein F5888DRAFT_31621 [Russula emetica]|nr:hypothetical protein F5888DRAFT_31621 [Russula emetica]
MTLTLLVRDPKLHVQLVPAFVTLLALGGQAGLPILVLTCLRSKRLNRHSTFVNCCVTSIIYSLVFCILLSRFPRFAALRPAPPHSLTFNQLTPFSISMGTLGYVYIEYILGNIGARSLIMLSVLHRHLWSWPFSRWCPSLSSCLCSRPGRHSKILVLPFSSHLRGVICSSFSLLSLTSPSWVT